MQNKKQSIELADIFSSHAEAFKKSHILCAEQLKAYNAITLCRTSALGGHTTHCDSCGHVRNAYNSCRNRHCPKCQFIKKEQWVDKLAANLPPVKHFHLVFTIPQELNKLFYLNQDKAYKLLFKAASESLLQLAAQGKHLGVQAGAVAILHTWGQNLSYHPHIHMLVPAGGLSDDQMEWIHSSRKYFLPVKVISPVFRGILYRLMEQALKKEELRLSDDIKDTAQLKNLCYKKNWVVYAEKPFSDAGGIIHYLGNYTHRVAISNNRLMAHADNKVTFSFKDYKNGGIKSKVTLDAHEFIRRFLQHVLPCGFYKIRYYGFLALSNIKTKLHLVYSLLPKATYLSRLEGLSALEVWRELTGNDPLCCPKCKQGKMVPGKLAEPATVDYG
ncbi:MAG: putative transposase [Bacteroidetes bacterium ADurb.Bin408]|nr:MAG: putative transposase [Bacteroidetes bacterium ADurb.Bin408]